LSLRTGVQSSVSINPTSRLRDISSRMLFSRGDSAWKRYQELSHRLRLAGYVGMRVHIIVILIAVASILIAAVLGSAVADARIDMDENGSRQMVMMPVLFASVTALLLMYALRSRIESRARQMEESIDILLQLTRMLWSTGMTLEMMFQQLSAHLRDISP